MFVRLMRRQVLGAREHGLIPSFNVTMVMQLCEQKLGR